MVALYKQSSLKRISCYKLDFCKYCLLDKQPIMKFKIGKHKIEDILDYVHSDVWGMIRDLSLGGS